LILLSKQNTNESKGYSLTKGERHPKGTKTEDFVWTTNAKGFFFFFIISHHKS